MTYTVGFAIYDQNLFKECGRKFRFMESSQKL
jgi:hypothetical protein